MSGLDRLPLAASSSQIDVPASALPRSSTALGSWTVQVTNTLVMDFFSWCFFLFLLPSSFSPKLEFLPGFVSTDQPWRASPFLVGAVRGFLGCQLSWYQFFFWEGLSWQPAVPFSLLHFQLPSPRAISTPASTEPEPGQKKIESGSLVCL